MDQRAGQVDDAEDAEQQRQQGQDGADDAADEAGLGLAAVVRQPLRRLLLAQVAEHDAGDAGGQAERPAAHERDRRDAEDQRQQAERVVLGLRAADRSPAAGMGWSRSVLPG